MIYIYTKPWRAGLVWPLSVPMPGRALSSDPDPDKALQDDPEHPANQTRHAVQNDHRI